MTDHDFLPESSWVISTHEQLREKLKLLTPEKLEQVCPQLKEWRERAIELQAEPAAMAVGMMQLTEECNEWKEAAHALRNIGTNMIQVLDDPDIPQEAKQFTIDVWQRSTTGSPWETATFHLYRNAEVIYCASSLDHCWSMFTRDTGIERGGEDGEEFDPFEQIPDDEELEIGSEDPSGDPTEELRTLRNKDGKDIGAMFFEKKTARVWASISGPGHFSGGDY